MTLLEEYVAGTVPGDDKSVFLALIEMVDGSPLVTWSPALNGEGVKHGVRIYRLFGSNSLGPGAEWREVEDAASSGCHFFKVTVELP